MIAERLLTDQWVERIHQFLGIPKKDSFDLPSLDTLFLVFPFSWKGTLAQYTGRLNHTFYGKKEIRVYDYVDEKATVLLGMYRRRLRSYKNLGFVVV
jgi:superfamily II DNA or RNA helicase